MTIDLKRIEQQQQNEPKNEPGKKRINKQTEKMTKKRKFCSSFIVFKCMDGSIFFVLFSRLVDRDDQDENSL